MSRGQLLALLPALLAGVKDPRIAGAALAGFKRGQDRVYADREDAYARDVRQQKERSDFYTRLQEQAATFDDPLDFEAWQTALGPIAEMHGIDMRSVAFSNRAAQAKDEKLIATALSRAVELHGKDILDPDARFSLQLPDGRSIPMSRALTMTGGTVTQDGKFVRPPKTVKAQDPYTLNQGDKRFGPDNVLVASNDKVETPAVGFTLGPGQVRYGPDNKQVAAGPPRAPAGRGRGVDPALEARGRAVLASPGLFNQLTPTEKGALVPFLAENGFEFGKELSDSAIKSITESRSAMASLKDLRVILQENEQYIGPVAGLAALNPYSEARRAQADINRVRQRVGKALEGGVLRKEDEIKYKDILATLLDTPDTAIYKVDQMLEELQHDMDTFIETQRGAGRRVGGVQSPSGKKDTETPEQRAKRLYDELSK
ncbi:MAG: hypothetical protein ABL982_00080 [Vicinamibacterales bacterium]